MAFDDDWDPEREEEQDYFDAKEAQKHLLIIRAFDAPRYYRTENNQDGMVHPNRSRGQNFEPFPNLVVRCAVADLDADGGPKVYPTAVLFPSSITKIAKAWVGKGPQLLMWRKGPNQTDPFQLRNMRGDESAVKAGMQFLNEHPEFMTLPAPDPYDERPPLRDDDRRDRGYGGRSDDWSRDDRDRRRDDRGARDNGQHDDWGRGSRGGASAGGASGSGAYADDPWARETGSRDGSFMSRSANTSRNGFQDDEPPF